MTAATSVADAALDPRGPVADAIVRLWWLMLVLGVVVFVAFAVLLGAGLLRRSSDESPGEERHAQLVRRWIGIGGVAVPVVVIIVVFAATLVVMRDVPRRAAGDALEVEVIGHQFWYEVRYPSEGIVTANEIHVPTGRDLAFTVTSRDVIHSFWVRELGGKLDMLPERRNTIVLRADEPGRYRARCAEFCGLQHAKMGLVVVAEAPEDFSAWVADHRQIAAAGTASAGRDVFVRSGCVACHAPRGEGGGGVAPDLTDLPMRSTLAATTLPNTRENLAAFITDPQKVKQGIEMPGATLAEDELRALLDYLMAAR